MRTVSLYHSLTATGSVQSATVVNQAIFGRLLRIQWSFAVAAVAAGAGLVELELSLSPNVTVESIGSPNGLVQLKGYCSGVANSFAISHSSGSVEIDVKIPVDGRIYVNQLGPANTIGVAGFVLYFE